MAQDKEIRHIVRIRGVDLEGSRPVGHQLTMIKGVGTSFSNMVCNMVGVPKLKKTGELSDEEVKRIEEAITDPLKFGGKEWMLNRRRDPESGKNWHISGSELKFTQDNDIKIMRKIKSYKGMRHSAGLPVRGQRTKSNFRKNKGKAQGVKKKKEAAK